MNNILSIHGGETRVIPTDLGSTKNSKINKTKNTIKHELNFLDNLITSYIKNKKLSNDVRKDNGLKDISKDNKISEPTPVTLMTIRGGKKDRTKIHDSLRVLIDTGCSHSIISKKYCSKFKSKNIKTYSTGSGSLTAKYDSKIHFALPEFSDKKIINWTFSVANTEDLGYDAIIGRDLLLNLK